MAEKYKCIDTIILQQISLKNNFDKFEELVGNFGNLPKVRFALKKYIHFPGVSSPLETKEVVYVHESTMLYKILGEITPFKCLKPWIKKEVGVLSDGSFVPCCLTINKEFELGNSRTSTLDELFDSDDHRKFRRSIFFKNYKELGNICAQCTMSSEPAIFFERVEELSYLKSLCLNDWR